jgi:hypothetical protein
MVTFHPLDYAMSLKNKHIYYIFVKLSERSDKSFYSIKHRFMIFDNGAGGADLIQLEAPTVS